jgi:long-chain acyl-CoA synthetase
LRLGVIKRQEQFALSSEIGNHDGMHATGGPTISSFLLTAVESRGTERALGYFRNGELTWLSWSEVFDAASQLAARMRAVGIEPGDCVAHVSENRCEWIITDLALHLAGAVHVPIHCTLSGEQIAAQIVDSGSKLVFASRVDLLATFADKIDASIPTWIHESTNLSDADSSPGGPLDVVTPREADDLATILYTSGTTGKPRGVMLSHNNLASNAYSTMEAFGADAEQTRLGILPLSHIYARTCDLYTWVCLASRLVVGESRETLPRDLQLVRPTAFNAVPFVYQRIADRIRDAGRSEADEAAMLRGYFGGQVDKLCSGGAPLAPDVEQWFLDRGLPILPGYGLTESSPVTTMSCKEARRFGTVGRAIPGVEVRIASDCEVLTRGPHVMLGYWKDAAATELAIRDGWLHTGDLGRLDADGYLTISGRKKELIVLSTGKKVHPVRIESLLVASPLIEQAAVFGDGCTHLMALIVPACGGADSGNGAVTEAAIEAELARCLQSCAHEEHVRRFTILERPFSVERGEMTPKLSLCRTVIARNFANELDAMKSSRSRFETPT